MTYIDGAPMPPRDDAHRWIGELARALASVHAVGRDARASALEHKGGPVDRARWMCERFRAGDALSQDVIRAVTRVASNVRRNADVFVHGDFWYGNTVWLEGRIVGLVDWFNAGIGDPAMEVAYARVDAALVLGLDAADEIGERYAHLRLPLSHQAFWDALAALPGLTMLRDWVTAYAEVGFVIDEAEARSRLERFVDRALSTLP